MLERAKDRAARFANLSLIEGDAAREPLVQGSFDLVFSRFGVMFFSDPARAFARLRSALRASGRVAFACWQTLADNPWALVPFEAVASVLGRPEPEPDDAPGPFSFGDAARLHRILEGAGFRDIDLQPYRTAIAFGASGSVEDAVNEIARVGPVGRLLADRDPNTVARALAAIAAMIPAFRTAQGVVRFPAAAWIVTAKNAG
jgi:SAM-dependent methyltransferase